jgi:hypothetical protein
MRGVPVAVPLIDILAANAAGEFTMKVLGVPVVPLQAIAPKLKGVQKELFVILSQTFSSISNCVEASSL